MRQNAATSASSWYPCRAARARPRSVARQSRRSLPRDPQSLIPMRRRSDRGAEAALPATKWKWPSTRPRPKRSNKRLLKSTNGTIAVAGGDVNSTARLWHDASAHERHHPAAIASQQSGRPIDTKPAAQRSSTRPVTGESLASGTCKNKCRGDESIAPRPNADGPTASRRFATSAPMPDVADRNQREASGKACRAA